jgi:predicted amidophosphoribosyltransferase
MAGVLARRCDLTVLPRACRRIRHTPPQTGLAGTARRLNLHDAFRVDGDVCGLSLAIVDDVVTTGATVSSLARALKDAGAARVEVWCAARVVGPATRPRAQGRKV